MQKTKRRVVLLGWDAADWILFHPLLDAGLMPNLSKLIDRGVMGKIATMRPPLSPLLWTSVATGVKPDRHGILGFFEPDPVSGKVRPVSHRTRKVKAIWNMLHQSGLRSIALNWYASHPAEPVNGVVVSDAYHSSHGPHGAPWPVPPGAIHPALLADKLADLRVHWGDLKAIDLLPFIPDLGRVDQVKDRHPFTLAMILSENITVHSAATWLMENEEWDFLTVFFPLIDHVGHAFMQFRAPRLPSIPEDLFDLYKGVMDGACCFLDMMLGRIIHVAGQDATIIIASDHGLQSGPLRPTGTAIFGPEAPAQLHRSHGIFCMSGPGIRHDKLVFGAELVDITPTILTLFGLPCGKDMQGRVLTEAFEEQPAIETIPSWEELAGDCGKYVANEAEDEAWDSAMVLKQLAELGYIDPLSGDDAANVKMSRDHYDYNLGRVHLGNGQATKALPLFEALVESSPNELTYELHLAQCYYEVGRTADCERVIEGVMQKFGKRPNCGVILANLKLAQGDVESGIELLRDMERSWKPTPGIRNLLGRIYLSRQLNEDAERAFRSLIALDPDHSDAHAGLAATLLAQGKNEAAAAMALDAIALQFDLPEAHFTLGSALAQSGKLERAIQAFEICLALRPNSPRAHEWLVLIRRSMADHAARRVA